MPNAEIKPGAVRRLQFDILENRVAEFDQLVAFCDLSTRKDLFDNAMTLFQWAVKEVENGRDIASYDRASDAVEVVRLPVLENAARRARNARDRAQEAVVDAGIASNLVLVGR